MNVYTAQSEIENAGKGLFSRAHIARGEVVVQMDTLKTKLVRRKQDFGVRIPPDGFLAIRGGRCLISDYNMGLEHSCDVNGIPLWYYMNHSQYKANVEPRLLQGVILWIALRDIQPDEELLFNYSSEACRLYG